MSLQLPCLLYTSMGNVGGTAAQILYDKGCKIVAVSDYSGGVYNENGLDIPAIRTYLSDKTKALIDYVSDDVKHISNDEVITCCCDVLIPAALENQITGEKMCIRDSVRGRKTSGQEKDGTIRILICIYGIRHSGYPGTALQELMQRCTGSRIFIMKGVYDNGVKRQAGPPESCLLYTSG